MKNKKENESNAIIGSFLGGCGLIGASGFLLAISSFSNDHFVAAGISLIASALSLGLAANAILRH